MKPIYALALMVSLVLCTISAQNPALTPALTKITTVEGITEYRLPNGLHVLLFPDASKPAVTVNVTYMVGSRHEGSGEGGMAHLLEHMLFKGTDSRPEIVTDIRSHSNGFNGTTSYDRTNYFETMNATDENLTWALALEADRMVHSRVAKADLDTEMTVVRNEFEASENNPLQVLDARVRATAYLWHSYGRSPIGLRSDIERVPIDRLQAFYHKYYQPDNAVLIVAGKFDEARATAAIQETFGKIPRPQRVLTNTYTEEPVQDGEREVTLRRTGDTQAITIAYHTPAGAHGDTAALRVLASVLGANPAGRLYKGLVDAGRAVTVNASASDLFEPGLFIINATARKDQPLAALEEPALRIAEVMAANPPTADEVERAKQALLRNINLAFNDSTNIALSLSSSVANGDWRLLFSGRDEIGNVTPADVARVAGQYLKTSNRTVGHFIPEDKPDRAVIPPAPNLISKLNGYTGRTDVVQGEQFDPTPENLAARIIRVTLPNGMKIALLPKQNRGGEVVATLDLHFGTAENLRGKAAVGGAAASLLMRGSSDHNRQQIQDTLSRLGAQMSMGGSAQGVSATIRTTRTKLADTLRLAAEIVRLPTYPEAELEQFRKLGLAQLESGLKEPAAIVSRELQRHVGQYPEGDIRATPTPEEQRARLEAVTIDQVKQFYKDYYGASHAELAVIGDFDPAEVETVVRQLFGEWKSPANYEVINRVASKVDPANLSFETPDKANAVIMAVLPLPVGDTDEDFVSLWIIKNLMGGNPKSRLFKRVREKEGLSYSVATAYDTGNSEGSGQFVFQAIANPKNAQRVKEIFQEEFKRAYDEGFSAEEVKDAEQQFLRDNAMIRTSDPTMVGVLSRYERSGRDMSSLRKLLDDMEHTSPEKVNAVFRKYLDPRNFSIAVAGDFSGAK
ncbi:MAG: M16 family metallopeptidase [Terriglobales bacterium]